MPLSAIILAGGHSTRMGRDKALIEIEGVPLLQRTGAIAQSCASPVFVVTPWPDRYATLLPDCQFVSETPLPGETEPHGPLVGFWQGLERVAAGGASAWVLLLACDLPRLQAVEVQQWAAQLETVQSGAIAYLPRDSQGWQPLCGFYRLSSLSLLRDFVQAGGRSFQQWLAQHPVAEIPAVDFAHLLNCNMPEDLTHL
ncbi:molybdenum cofactor guanylyltransferase [Thermoleptolyngbya sichuanensis XZ-Cy5]|uniref:molybdenum cofactor guanylyltransferase n=1 Tax=Thermoleptolyngbya sichuanensis TaxID=2885951 RepID=UPI00240D0480|nr:molybdenum cofactor guanylyltransferase [Thermoleptolyngbya sichuanensis]MDG2618152.1 molybdenum cofactor guanylyltransferase [Thermoleptolyngbya sichuanensis XZ-Cy5]